MLLATTMFLSLLLTAAEPVNDEPIVLDLGTDTTAELAVDLGGTDLRPSPDPGTQPTAICRLIPQCDSNADCVALCGTEGAKCVHSRCPVRVCRC
jgi:hypothetical protein